MSGVIVPVEMLRSLVDAGECWFDHHGGCQEHGYLSLQPGQECPQRELKRRLEVIQQGCDYCGHRRDDHDADAKCMADCEGALCACRVYVPVGGNPTRDEAAYFFDDGGYGNDADVGGNPTPAAEDQP